MAEIPLHHEQTAPTTESAQMMTFTPGDMYAARPIPNVVEGNSWAFDKRLEYAPNLREAVQEARNSGKPLVVIFEEDYCGWCRKLDQELAKPELARLNDKAIFVRVSPSSSPEAKILADRLGVNAYPTISVIDIKGSNISERNRVTGFTTASDIASRVQPPLRDNGVLVA